MKAGKFFLQITRIEPDNLPLEIVKEFCQSGIAKTGYKYVVVGFKDATSYSLKLKSYENNNCIVILPAIFDQEILYTFRNNCFCYVHGNSVGGTNPALLEAMQSCSRILAIMLDLIGKSWILWKLFFTRSFEANISELSFIYRYRKKIKNRVIRAYQWDAVSAGYMAIVKGTEPDYPHDKL